MTNILLTDLQPGTDYVLQLRANTGDAVSDWSRKFDITTDGDTQPPDAPEWISPLASAFRVDGDTFVAEWVAIDLNLSQNMDFSHYELHLTNGSLDYYINTNNTSFVLTYEQNRIFFGTPAAASVSAEVRSVDLTGNASAWTSLQTESNPAPSAVVNLFVYDLYDSIKVKWDANTEEDIAKYRVQVSTTGVGGAYSTVYEGPNNEFIYQTVMWATDHYFKVYAVDKFNSASLATTAGPIKPKSSFALDGTPPAVPTGLAATLTTSTNGAYSIAEVTWDANVESDLGGYRIRYRKTGTSGWESTTIGTDTTTTSITGLEAFVSYDFQIQSFDFAANESAFSSTVVATAPSVPTPPTPQAPTVSANTMLIQVTPTGLDSGSSPMPGNIISYLVYASTTTGFTPSGAELIGSIAVGPAMTASFPIPADGGGSTETWYVKVKAVNSGGAIGAASAQATSTPNLIANANIVDATITNAKIQSLSVDKLTAGTGVANDFTVKSQLTLGESGNDGQITSWDYITSGGTTGFSLDSSGLVIKTGSISASALTIQVGSNLMDAPYADFEAGVTYYDSRILPAGGTGSWLIDSTEFKFNEQSLKLTYTSGGTYYETALTSDGTSTGYTINLEPSKTYLVSVYAKTGTGTGNKTFRMGRGAPLLANALLAETATIVADGTWQRFTFTMTTDATTTKAMLIPRLATVGTIWIDGLKVEEKIGGTNTPSSWTPPGSTRIDGNIIRTGSIQSSADAYDVTGEVIVGQKAWSIDMEGQATFGDVLVRGRIIVGEEGSEPVVDPVTGEETDQVGVSQVQSYNFDGTKGWAIRSNGVAEFYQLKANSIHADAIAVGTVNPDKLAPGTIAASLVIGDQLQAVESETLQIVNKQLSGNIVTITLSEEHNRIVGERVSVKMEPADAVFDSVGDNYDVVTAVTTTTFSYARTSANVSLTTASGTATFVGRSVVMSYDGISLFDNNGTDLVVRIPTNPKEDALFTGNIDAKNLIVRNSLMLQGGTNYLSNGSTLTLAATMSAPLKGPSYTQTWDYTQVSVSGLDKIKRVGLTYDSGAGNWKFLNKTTTGSWEVVTFDSVGTVTSVVPMVAGGRDVFGMVKVASNWYILTQTSLTTIDWTEKIRVYKMASTGTGFDTIESYWTYDTDAPQFDYTDPAIGTDGTYIYIIRSQPSNISGGAIVSRFSLTGTGRVDTTTNITSKYSWKSFQIGSFDLGATRWLATSTGTTTTGSYTYSMNTSGVHQVNETFPSGTKIITGCTWDGSSFRTLDTLGKHYLHTDAAKSGTGVWVAKSTWYNLANNYETGFSPTVTLTMYRRSKLTLYAGALISSGNASDPDRARFYVAKGLAASSYRQTEVGAGVTFKAFPTSPIASGSTTTSGVSFPSVSPAKFVSSNGLMELSAAGTAILGSTSDVNTSAGNTPALRIGAIGGTHLRMDGNEVQAMASDTTTGTYNINLGGGNVNIGGNNGSVQLGGPNSRAFTRIRYGEASITSNASGTGTFTHGLGVAPDIVIVSRNRTGPDGFILKGSVTSTTVEVDMYTVAGAPFTTGQVCDISWIAIVV